MPAPERIAGCVFDAYGTLLDVHSAVRRHAAHLGEIGAVMSATWRTKQLEYTWLRSLTGVHADFWQVTADALDVALELHGIDDPELRKELLNGYLTLSAYPDVHGVINELTRHGIRQGILSNGTDDMLAAAVAASGLDRCFDYVISIDEVGVYKPDPRVYRLAAERLGLAMDQILFVSSNCWDAIGARHSGMQVAWVNRTGQPMDRLGAEPHVEIADLTMLTGLLNTAPGVADQGR